jgi:hypothetical protein
LLYTILNAENPFFIVSIKNWSGPSKLPFWSPNSLLIRE